MDHIFQNTNRMSPNSISDVDLYMLLAAAPSKSSNIGLIIGASVGGCILLLLLILAGFYGLRQRRRAETATKKNNPFGMAYHPKIMSGCLAEF